MTGERRKQGTLYRVDLPANSRTALYGGLSEQYVDDPAFAVDTVSIGTADGLVIRGVSGHAAEWCDAATVLTGFGVDLSDAQTLLSLHVAVLARRHVGVTSSRRD